MRISAIVPAHNEGPRILEVLEVLKNTPRVHEIIVVDDGSSDDTAEVAGTTGAVVIRNESREGKGQALERGIRGASSDVLFFCDADIQGLTPQMIEEILAPVVRGDAEMSIGARKSKVRHLIGKTYSPLLDGQRALTRALWARIPSNQKRGYRVEVALNYYAHSYTYRLFEISQATKEDKRGFVRGRYERCLMYKDVFVSHVLNMLQSK